MGEVLLGLVFYSATLSEIVLVVYALTIMRTHKERLPLVAMLMLCIYALFLSPTSAHASEVQVATPVVAQTRAEYILEKVKEGDAVCSQVPLVATIESEVRVGKEGEPPVITKRVTERPVALCAWSEATGAWHVIQVRLQYPIPQTYITCVKTAPSLEDRRRCALPYRVVTPGYRVEHVRGYGIVRLIFNVYKEESTTITHGDETQTIPIRGEKLTVYRTRHMWFDDEALASGDADRIIGTSQAINYTPYHPDFFDDDLVNLGAQFLFDQVHAVEEEMGRDLTLPNAVRSRAFPAQTLAETVPWEIPVSLAAIEQIDDKTFQADKKRAVDAVFIEYAINGVLAFRLAQSGANAIGPLQYTKNTYEEIVALYPGGCRDPNFATGARDLHNVLGCAIALIDYEVSNFSEIKPIFKKNPKLGGAFPVAAYNGSPQAARALYAWFKKRGVNIEKKTIALPGALRMKRTEHCPCKNMPAGKGKKPRTVEHIVVNTETPGYLEKYLYLLNYLADLELE